MQEQYTVTFRNDTNAKMKKKIQLQADDTTSWELNFLQPCRASEDHRIPHHCRCSKHVDRKLALGNPDILGSLSAIARFGIDEDPTALRITTV